MKNNENEEIIITYDTMDFNPSVIGIILITDGGNFLYGKVNEKFLYDYKHRIGHTDIFYACAKKLSIDFSPGLDQMECAWQLAADGSNIISLQIIPPNEIIIVMNKNRTNNQVCSLKHIMSYFDEKKCLFTADILNCDDRISIQNESSTTNDFGVDLETFNNRLADILLNLSKKRK